MQDSYFHPKKMKHATKDGPGTELHPPHRCPPPPPPPVPVARADGANFPVAQGKAGQAWDFTILGCLVVFAMTCRLRGPGQRGSSRPRSASPTMPVEAMNAAGFSDFMLSGLRPICAWLPGRLRHFVATRSRPCSGQNQGWVTKQAGGGVGIMLSVLAWVLLCCSGDGPSPGGWFAAARRDGEPAGPICYSGLHRMRKPIPEARSSLG